ncbi:MAG: hypothetical protein CL933_01205 [Deltaproteobacteria bacterium]|nr:hypothetical protein [Deltaproteobacteria bacterium]
MVTFLGIACVARTTIELVRLDSELDPPRFAPRPSPFAIFFRLESESRRRMLPRTGASRRRLVAFCEDWR